MLVFAGAALPSVAIAVTVNGILPVKLAGGVIVSYLEWVQDLQNFFWEESEINRTLKTIMTRSFKEVWDFGKAQQAPLREAAVMLAVTKVADAIRTRGVFP